MKKKVLVLGISVILAWVLICGCSGGNVPVSEGNSDISYGSANQDPKNPVFSKDYIAGVDFGGIPFWYDEIYDTVSATLIFTNNKTIEVYMGQSLYSEHDTLIDTVPLTDEQYSSVEKVIDQKKLYKLDPGSDEFMTDGVYRYIFLYDENNELLKEVGGYEPTNDEFLNAYGKLQQNIPYDEVHEILEKQKQVMRYNDCLTDTGRISEDNLIASEAEKIIAPFNEGEMVKSADWTDDTHKCFRVMIINKDDNRLTKDYFFYREDDMTVIPVAVDYPSSEEVGADRYFENNWGENEARLEDVTFDGHDDLLISLDAEEGSNNRVFCAYIYDNGEFVYDAAFEKILNYKIETSDAVIISQQYDGKRTKKKYSYDNESKAFIEVE